MNISNFTPDQLAKNKKIIIELFRKNIKGKKADISNINARHDGKKGHWLETAMGVKHNGNNAPDILGFEMKNHTTSKTTLEIGLAIIKSLEVNVAVKKSHKTNSYRYLVHRIQ